MAQVKVLHSTLSRATACLTGLCLSLGVVSIAGAEPPRSPSAATTDNAALYVLDSTFGDGQSPLYFQVVGQGFRPGEQVTVQTLLAVPGQDAPQALQLRPVQVTANDYGQVAATIDSESYVASSDGFIIRATGDEHKASIIDLALAGASWTAPGGN